MKIWLDTIDCDVVFDGAKTGIISGVTTNPSILSGTTDVLETLKRLLDIQSGPVAVQVTAQNPEEIINEARRIFEFSNHIVVKIPINHSGLVAIKELKKDKIPLLGTAILFPTQALLAANLEVDYISPYFSHMANHGDAYETLKTIVDMLKTSNTKILVASLRQLDHIIYCALLGVDGITIKPDLYNQLVADHPVVEGFTERFLSDWTRTHGGFSIKETLTQKYRVQNKICLAE